MKLGRKKLRAHPVRSDFAAPHNADFHESARVLAPREFRRIHTFMDGYTRSAMSIGRHLGYRRRGKDE